MWTRDNLDVLRGSTPSASTSSTRIQAAPDPVGKTPGNWGRAEGSVRGPRGSPVSDSEPVSPVSGEPREPVSPTGRPLGPWPAPKSRQVPPGMGSRLGEYREAVPVSFYFSTTYDSASGGGGGHLNGLSASTERAASQPRPWAGSPLARRPAGWAMRASPRISDTLDTSVRLAARLRPPR